jgi:hypothetical protein
MKETYYFTHDYNVRTDAKIKKLLTVHGYLGYGIFWALIEDLYNNNNHLPTDLDVIAYDLRAEKSLIESVLMDFGLFCVADGFFSSCSVKKRMNDRDEKSRTARKSAYKRWGKGEDPENAMPMQSEGTAIKEKKEKEIKEKEKKESKEDHPLKNSNLFRQPKIPSPEQVNQAFLSSGGTVEMADKFYQKHTSVGWFLQGSPITNFKNLVPSYIANWNKNLQNDRGNSKNKDSSTGKAIVFDRA